MTVAWFSLLEPVHETHCRVRFRYTCQAPREAHAIVAAITPLDGVQQVRVNPATRSMIIAFDPKQTNVQRLGEAILGLRLPLDAHGGSGTGEASLNAVAASGATLLASRSLQPKLQGPAALITAIPVFGDALDDFLEKGVTSHVLEALAVAISIGRGDFLAANTTSFLLALGEYLEHSIQRRSDAMLKGLLRPGMDSVWVERNGEEIQVETTHLTVGETVIVVTGQTIPVDGTVLGGEASVNEATMTGEGVPVVKHRGDKVLAGTLVEEGRLRVYAEQVGRQAAAARIAEFVEHSLEIKSNTQLQAANLADRLVPMVLGLGLVTWVASRDWERVSAVLQADYSCALKLATPVAFKAAMYCGGQSHILVKSAAALEHLAAADTFVFDKTGTLTCGALEVTESVTFSSRYTSDDLINLAASVEEHYVHPMALAVVEAARQLEHQHHFRHKEVEFIVAHGVASVVEGQRIVVGSRHFVEEDEGIEVTPHQETIDRLSKEGKTLLYIGFGGELLGVLALHDQVRDNSAATLTRLRKLGVTRLVMLTGDHPERAQHLAAELGLDECHAGLLPEDKARVLQELAEQGAQIAFIGDGVNDAPALSGAQVGISMHNGADVARLAADISLLEDDIGLVADARELALATQRLVDGNFQLTVGLNSAILLAAAFGGLSPVRASMLHNGSTIAILLRALVGAGLPRRARQQRTKKDS